MDLRHLTDKSLLADTKFLASREREITTKMLHHLKEIDKRRLYSDLGYNSLFAYTTKELGFSEAEAVRRIQAARVLIDLPAIEKKIEDGSLSMTNVGLLNKFFKENEIETAAAKMDIVAKIENLSTRDCEKELFNISGKSEPDIKDKKKRISSTRMRYSITLSDETSELLDEAKGLIQVDISIDGLIKKIATLAIEHLKKEKFKLTKSMDVPSAPHVNRVISARVKKSVYLRDKRCTNCGSIQSLQYDHIVPYSMGGTSRADNVRLLCFNCNQRARIRMGL